MRFTNFATCAVSMFNVCLRRFLNIHLLSVLVISQLALSADADEPKSLEEGYKALQLVLGELDEKNPKPWYFESTNDLRTREKEGDPETQVVNSSRSSISQPTLEGSSISFTEVSLGSKKVSQISDNGDVEPLYSYTHHWYAKRKLTFFNGQWFLVIEGDGVFPDYRSTPPATGIVKWNEDGFEFTYQGGVGKFFMKDGELRSGISWNKQKYSVKSGKLHVENTQQVFDFQRAPSGEILTAPDFTKPLTVQVSWTEISE